MKIFAVVESFARRPILRNAGWLMAGQGFGMLLQAVYFVILGRLLGSTEYGVFVGAFAFTSLVAPYSSLGAGTVFLRYCSGKPQNFPFYFGNILVVTLATGTLLVLILQGLAPHLIGSASAKLVLLAAIANCLFAQLTIEIGRVFQAFERMRTTSMLNLLMSAVRTVTVAVMLKSFHHVSSYQWALVSTIVSGVAAAFAVGLTIWRLGRPQFSLPLAKQRALEGLGFSFAASTSSVYNDLDKSMLSHYGMNEQNGIYSVAYRLVDFATMPIFAVRDVTLPRMFQRGHQDMHGAVQYGRRLMPRAMALGGAAAVGVFLLAPVVPRLVGPSFSASVDALRWLAIIPLLRSVHQISGSVLTVTGHQGARTLAQIICAVLNFGLNLWLIPSYGWHGAAWSSVVTDGTLAILTWSILRFMLRHSARVATNEAA